MKLQSPQFMLILKQTELCYFSADASDGDFKELPEKQRRLNSHARNHVRLFSLISLC